MVQPLNGTVPMNGQYPGLPQYGGQQVYYDSAAADDQIAEAEIYDGGTGLPELPPAQTVDTKMATEFEYPVEDQIVTGEPILPEEPVPEPELPPAEEHRPQAVDHSMIGGPAFETQPKRSSVERARSPRSSSRISRVLRRSPRNWVPRGPSRC